MILTTESVDEILWCDHSNETSPAVLSHGANLYLSFLQNEIRDLSWILILGTLGSERLNSPYDFLYASDNAAIHLINTKCRHCSLGTEN